MIYLRKNINGMMYFISNAKYFKQLLGDKVYDITQYDNCQECNVNLVDDDTIIFVPFTDKFYCEFCGMDALDDLQCDNASLQYNTEMGNKIVDIIIEKCGSEEIELVDFRDNYYQV